MNMIIFGADLDRKGNGRFEKSPVGNSLSLLPTITNLKEWQWHGGEEVRWDVFEVEVLEAQVDERGRLAKEGEEVEERQGGGTRGQVCSLHLVGRLNADDDVKKDQDKAEGGGDEYDAIGCCTDIVVMKNRIQERSMDQK